MKLMYCPSPAYTTLCLWLASTRSDGFWPQLRSLTQQRDQRDQLAHLGIATRLIFFQDLKRKFCQIWLELYRAVNFGNTLRSCLHIHYLELPYVPHTLSNLVNPHHVNNVSFYMYSLGKEPRLPPAPVQSAKQGTPSFPCLSSWRPGVVNR